MTVRSWKQVSAPAAPRAQARVRFGSLAVGGGWQLLLIVWTILVVFPFVWMVVSALKTDQEIFFSPWALPATLHLDNFARAWSTAAMGAYFVNSQWNQFILPLVLNPDRERYVLSQGLAFLVVQQVSERLERPVRGPDHELRAHPGCLRRVSAPARKRTDGWRAQGLTALNACTAPAAHSPQSGDDWLRVYEYVPCV